MLSDENIPKVIKAYYDELEKLNNWNVSNIAEVINNVKERTGIKGKLLYMPIRIKRIIDRDKLTEDEIMSRINNQMSQEEKEKLSHFLMI